MYPSTWVPCHHSRIWQSNLRIYSVFKEYCVISRAWIPVSPLPGECPNQYTPGSLSFFFEFLSENQNNFSRRDLCPAYFIAKWFGNIRQEHEPAVGRREPLSADPPTRGRTSPALELAGLMGPGSRLPSLPISQRNPAIDYFPYSV